MINGYFVATDPFPIALHRFIWGIRVRLLSILCAAFWLYEREKCVRFRFELRASAILVNMSTYHREHSLNRAHT